MFCLCYVNHPRQSSKEYLKITNVCINVKNSGQREKIKMAFFNEREILANYTNVVFTILHFQLNLRNSFPQFSGKIMTIKF